MIKTILVDDEKNNLDLLTHYIQKYCSELEIIACCLTYDEAIKSISLLNPDLVFLDIVLDRDTSFDLLEELPRLNFQIVFTTAHSEYALEAFKFNTVNYLLKPIEIKDLVSTVDDIIVQKKEKQILSKEQIKALSNSISEEHPINFITISGMDRVDFIHPSDIIYIRSSGRYSEFFLRDKKRKVLSSKAIGEYESKLDKSLFYRIHNSYLINLSHLININKKAGNYCEMTNGDAIPISRRRYEGLMRFCEIKIKEWVLVLFSHPEHVIQNKISRSFLSKKNFPIA